MGASDLRSRSSAATESEGLLSLGPRGAVGSSVGSCVCECGGGSDVGFAPTTTTAPQPIQDQ